MKPLCFANTDSCIGRTMAVRLLHVLWVMAASGCIVPPHLEDEQPDAAMNHKPDIRRDLTGPNKVAIPVFQTPPSAPSFNVTSFSISVQDVDNDVVQLRMFLNRKYGEIVIDKQSEGDTASVTLMVVEIPGLCDDKVGKEVPGNHLLEAMISDRGFVSSGKDLHQVNPGGGKDTISWIIECNLSPPEG
jgi:hypothetical protein